MLEELSYYEKNRDRIIERQKAYNEKNKEKIKQKKLNDPNYKENRAKIMKKYYQNLKNNDPEKYNLMIEKTRERSRLYRQKKRQEMIENGTYKPSRKSPNLNLSDEEKKLRQKEYKKKYIQSLKNNPEKYENHKNKTNARVKKCYKNKKLNELKCSE
jgi:hypothetical protein